MSSEIINSWFMSFTFTESWYLLEKWFYERIQILQENNPTAQTIQVKCLQMYENYVSIIAFGCAALCAFLLSLQRGHYVMQSNEPVLKL